MTLEQIPHAAAAAEVTRPGAYVLAKNWRIGPPVANYIAALR